MQQSDRLQLISPSYIQVGQQTKRMLLVYYFSVTRWGAWQRTWASLWRFLCAWTYGRVDKIVK